MKIVQLSHYILSEYNDLQNPITHLKLQKLLYYIKVWGIVAQNDPLAEYDFVKWNHGPVNTNVYYEFREYKCKPIPFNEELANLFKSNSNTSELAHIKFILEVYSDYDAITLSAMTHEEETWKVAENNSMISNETILNYYSFQPFAKNFPFDKNNKFYPLQTDFYHSFIFDMDQTIITDDTFAFESFDAYLKMKQKNKQDFEEAISNTFS